jgi:hypothetical protein
MKFDRPSSGIDRRVLISGMALLPVLSGMPLAGHQKRNAPRR